MKILKSLAREWRLGLASLAIVGVASVAYAAGFLTNGIPVAGNAPYAFTIPLTGSEQLPADTLLAAGQAPQSEAITTNQLATFAAAQAASWNALIGGDASTNLFQRGTTGSSVTTTVTFGGPDRWAYWSGTGTAMTVSQSNTAAALPAGFSQTFRMQRTAAQTGVVQMCMAQEVESVNSYQFQGKTAELDFNVYTGANFSASPIQMTAYIIYGTGTDEGMQKLAFGLNAGGGGSAGWTGQANATAAVINLTAVSTASRVAAIASIPATATEVGVALCYTPVGTAGTTDALYFAGIQLGQSASNSGLASATVGYNCASIACKPFERRTQGLETALQQRYYYRLTEGAASTWRAPCEIDTTSIAICLITFPVTMRVAPTMTYSTGFAATNIVTAVSCTALTTSAVPTSNAANTQNVLVDCASSAGFSAASTAAMFGDNAGTGIVQANAEMT